MDCTNKLLHMTNVARCTYHKSSPVPQEGFFSEVKDVYDISGFSHSVGTCGLRQGACKLSLNVKKGIVEEALIETIGCSGMTQSAAMASEILPGKTLIEALNTDLVCDAINVAMREFVLAMIYGRTQSAYSEGGLAVGSGLEDLGNGLFSQVGTAYGTQLKGPRYMQVTEGYIQTLALDAADRIIGYKYVNIGKMMELISNGINAEDALKQASGTSGRYNEGVRFINPRKD